MDIRKFGYVRVSKQSGKDFDRDQYLFLKRMLLKDDILYVHSLDRFGRNKEAILQEWKEITRVIQATSLS
jgi:DNA invertase Pin-like site-specific DNA recombinase